jgi:hypothetical protein
MPPRGRAPARPARRGNHVPAPASEWATKNPHLKLAEDLKFSALCDFFDIIKGKRQGERRVAVRRFLETAVTGFRFDEQGSCVYGPAVTTPPERLGDVFQLFRLILPGKDDVRPPYGVS